MDREQGPRQKQTEDVWRKGEVTPGEALWSTMDGIGFYTGNQQEAYGAVPFAIMTFTAWLHGSLAEGISLT